MHTVDGIPFDTRRHVLGLAPGLTEPVTVGEHHRPHRGGDEQRRGRLQQHDIAGEQQRGHSLRVAALGGVGLLQPGRAAHEDRLPGGEHQQARQPEHREDTGHSLPPQGLRHGVAAVDADQHHDEQEQHQDGARVDDDLHHEQERRILRGVEDREPDHHPGHADGRVRRLAGHDDADREQHHDRGAHHEGDELTRQRGQGDHFTAPCSGAVRVSG